MVCRQWLRFQKHYTFNVNYEYEIMRVGNSNIALRYDEDINLNIPIQTVRDNFITIARHATAFKEVPLMDT